MLTLKMLATLSSFFVCFSSCSDVHKQKISTFKHLNDTFIFISCNINLNIPMYRKIIGILFVTSIVSLHFSLIN